MDQVTPYQVAACGNHSLALRCGTVWAWGDNALGQIGDGTKIARWLPQRVPVPPAAAIAAGETFCLAADAASGRVYAWGDNEFGQLGDGTSTPHSGGVLVAGVQGVTALAAGDHHALALTADGRVYAWGSNSHCQLGIRGREIRQRPRLVPGLPGPIIAIAARGHRSLALTADGRVFAWGARVEDRFSYDSGYVGCQYKASRYGYEDRWWDRGDTPRSVSGLPRPIVAIAMSRYSAEALDTDGGVWQWDADYSARHREGRRLLSSPCRIERLCWGFHLGETHMSVGGELAGGINALAEHPMLRASTVSGLARGGNHMLAALDDGRVLAWGCNDDGQLGIGSDYWARREQVGGIGKVWQWLPVEVVLPVPIPLEFAPAPPKAPATIGLVRLDGTLDPQRAREISDYIEPSLTAFAEAEWAVSEAGMRHPELAFTEIPGGVTLLAARDAAREAHHRALEPYRAVWPMIHAHLTGCPLP